ncbi:SGNH/GDSL hydrolase family protein [Peterkaempfera sp. SMS 1(5)a]|uniref:SGNH/GDSL hydrolase family protein n=1 Tax=Peterkaempfera podocarpi TaxID=3232308 RepID=UPI00366F71B8
MGLGDPVPGGDGGGWRGWAALLAPALRPEPGGVVLLNCAGSGALTLDVAGEQLAEALGHRPHLASVVVGANDTLRGGFDIEAICLRLDTVFGALHAQGAVLMTACLPDPGRMLGLPWPLARPLGRRMRSLNHIVHHLSRHYGAVHLHIGDHSWVLDRAAWSADRLHPSEWGHRLLAREFHTLLAAAGLAAGAPPSITPQGPGPGRAASVHWMATRGTRWVLDRCTDLLPDLLGLAAVECRHQVRGTTAALELAAHRATVGAIAALNLPDLPAAGRRTAVAALAHPDGHFTAPAAHLRCDGAAGDAACARPSTDMPKGTLNNSGRWPHRGSSHSMRERRH